MMFTNSIQLIVVYDQEITVSDYASYLNTGVTVALAWQLPDVQLILNGN